MNLRHRKIGWQLFCGTGLEIGALHEHTHLSSDCTVEYADAISKEEAMELFPEIDPSKLVDVQHIIDLDKAGLEQLEDETYDFVILSHVIEHVANPVNVVKELFRVCKKGGLVLIAAPDKNYTFDKNRALTPFSHLWEEYEQKVTEVTDAHYIDFMRSVHPDIKESDTEHYNTSLASIRSRREHAHVWDSTSFKNFLLSCFNKLNIETKLVMEHLGERNEHEYFSIWQKIDGKQKYPTIRLNLIQQIRLFIGR